MEGKNILQELLEQNDQNELAWAWLHVCVESKHEKIYCLKRVLELNPRNEGAKGELAKLTGGIYYTTKKVIVEEVKSKQKQVTKPEPIKKKKRQPKPIKLPKPKEPKIIFTKPGDDLFDDEKRSTIGLPDVEAGMYGNRFVIGDLVITPYDYPDCIEEGHLLKRSNCDVCEFFGYHDCPIRHDPEILLDVHTLFSGQKRFWVISDERRQSMLDAVYSELKNHGRPLHYDMLARIVKGQYPRLGLRPLRVLYLMERHPEKFECVGSGVYRAK